MAPRNAFPGDSISSFVRGWIGLLAALMFSGACMGSTQPLASHPSPQMVSGPAVGLGSLAFDQATGEMVLLDPSGGGTWTWDGVHGWQQQHPSAAPVTARGKMGGAPFGLAWDPNSRSLIAVIGDFPDPQGVSGNRLPAATWSWHAGNWTKLNNAGTPDVVGGAIADFPPKQQLVMFSGCCQVSQQERFLSAKPGMWIFDGLVWTEVHPVHMPPARWGAAVAFDAAIGKTVLYGGSALEPDHPPLNDMWAWDGTDWTQLMSPPVQSDLLVTQLGYSPDGSILLTATGQNLQAEIWKWRGPDWSKLDVATPGCFFCELAYDPARKQTVMVTNVQGRPDSAAEVWVWNGVRWSERS